MRIVKRIFAGFSAISVLVSFNMIRFISIAEETNNTDITQDSGDTEDNFDLIVDIPETWSKDLEDWIITADDDTILYYKTSVSPISEDSWGTYTDNDANAWNSGNDLDDGEGFIKFWAVKEVNGEEKIVNSEAVPYKYDTTPPNSFEIPERFKGPVCKTGIRRFESDFSLKNEGFQEILLKIPGSLSYFPRSLS